MSTVKSQRFFKKLALLETFLCGLCYYDFLLCLKGLCHVPLFFCVVVNTWQARDFILHKKRHSVLYLTVNGLTA